MRYVDQIILYTKSLENFESVTERLINALQIIKSTINVKQMKILRNNLVVNDYFLNFVNIGNEFFKVLNDTDFHRYLGRLRYTLASDRMKIVIRIRQRAA